MNNLLFVDIETTGLDPTKDDILEISAIKVDDKFNILATHHWLIEPVDFNPDNYDQWIQDTHKANGLFDDVEKSGLTYQEVSDALGTIMAGCREWVVSGIGPHFDRNFLDAKFGWFKFARHHRLFDVRSMLFCCDLKLVKPHPDNHRAVNDNLNAIYFARCYQHALQTYKAL